MPGWVWPDHSPEAELKSFKVHAENYFKPSSQSYTPPPERLEAILHVVEEAQKEAIWYLQDDFDSRENFERILKDLERHASPGYPYSLEAPTIGHWLKFDETTLQFCPNRVNELWYDVQMVLQGKYEHYFRAFIKSEPHKLEKAQQGRWRLIMASALPVQIVWHMLFDPYNQIVCDKALELPSQQGLILPFGGWKRAYRLWKRNKQTVGLDKSAWDWTAPYWTLQLDLELRFRLGRGSRMREWRILAEAMYKDAFCDSKIMFSNGVIYQQTVPGIMKSGLVNTISTNSNCQQFIHVEACLVLGIPILPLPCCCGDDTLQCKHQVEDLSPYRKMGVVVKTVSEGIEFIGHEFTDSGPAPLYIEKHFVNLLYQKTENLSEYLDAMCRMYCHTLYFSFWEEVANIFKIKTYSQQWYKHWYDVDS